MEIKCDMYHIIPLWILSNPSKVHLPCAVCLFAYPSLRDKNNQSLSYQTTACKCVWIIYRINNWSMLCGPCGVRFVVSSDHFHLSMSSCWISDPTTHVQRAGATERWLNHIQSPVNERYERYNTSTLILYFLIPYWLYSHVREKISMVVCGCIDKFIL